MLYSYVLCCPLLYTELFCKLLVPSQVIVLKSFIALEWVVFTLLTAAFSISQCITPLVMGKLMDSRNFAMLVTLG
jgi:hypothetical protein